MKKLFKGIAIGCALTICAGITVISSAEAGKKAMKNPFEWVEA